MTDAEIDSFRVIVDDQTRLAMAFILMGMMFTVALALNIEDFRAVRQQPVRVIGGVIAQILGLPLLTLGLVLILAPPTCRPKWQRSPGSSLAGSLRWPWLLAPSRTFW